MRTASLVVLALVSALAAGSGIPARERRVADKDFLVKQKNIVYLLTRPQQENLYKEQSDIGNSYDLEANLNNYNNPQWVKHFLHLYKHGLLLHRDETFSVLYKKHRYELEALFDLFFTAKDYETFYKTACWARDRVNHGTFINAFTVAVLHRPDTKDIILPPPYEIYPEFFVDSTAIQQAYEAQLRRQQFIILTNISSNVHNLQDLVSYFTEDVGLSTYLTYLNYEFPTWLKAHKYGFNIHRHGEIFYYTRQQLLARYQLQRLSSGLPGVETFDLNLNEPIKYGYNSDLRYKNGEYFPARPQGVYPQSNDLVSISELKVTKSRLLEVIDSGTFIKEDHDGITRVFLKDLNVIDVLGNLIEGNKCSYNIRYFKSYFLLLLSVHGHVVDPKHSYGVAPGALEHFETALRDPVYYVIIKEVLELFERYKSQLNSYTKDELIVPGVNIESVDVDKLVTYFDEFEFSLGNAVRVSSIEEAENVDLRIRQQRLNHRPATFRVTVNSDKNVRVLIRFFLGPKFDYLHRELSLDEKRRYFVEVDRFPYEIVAGKNVIERSTRESNAVVRDQLTTSVLLQKVEGALEGKEPLYIGSTFRHCGFPERLQFPRGSSSGFPFTLFVAISTFEGQDLNFQPSVVSCGPRFGYEDADTKAYGYPFDRIIYDSSNYEVPNFYKKDVLVFHKTEEEINKA